MSGALNHSPADVVAQLLVQVGQGTDPSLWEDGSGSAWPVFSMGLPALPDELLRVKDTQGRDDGRTQVDGERQEHHGFQIMVRSRLEPTGFAKARAVAVALDQGVYQAVVTLDGSSYAVHSVSRTGDVIPMGTEGSASDRFLFSVNGLVTLRMTS